MIKSLIIFFLVTLSIYATDEECRNTEPQKVQELAVRIAKQRYSDGKEQNEFMLAYVQGFKSGLVYKDSFVSAGLGITKDSESNGFSAGRYMAISNAITLGVSLKDYGYIATNVSGYVFLEFENQEFRPLGNTQVWWVVVNSETYMKYLKMTRREGAVWINRTGIIASCVGYLSPETRRSCGHFGLYSRELVANDSVTLIMKEEPQPSVRGDGKPAPQP